MKIILLAAVLLSLVSIATAEINLSRDFDVPIDVYILDKTIEKEGALSVIEDANKIWNQYNVSFQVESIVELENVMLEKEKSILFNENNCTLIKPIMNKIIKNDTLTKKIILIHTKNRETDGRACVCGCDFAIIDSFSKFNFLRNRVLGWNLAHEMGHLLQAQTVICKEKNLMIEDCGNNFFYLIYYKYLLKPKLLKKDQIESVHNALKGI